MDEKEKFTEAEIIVGGFAAVLIDLVCGAIDFFSAGIAAVAVTPIAQVAATGGIEWWVKEKGGDLGIVDLKRLAKYAVNAVPIIPTTLVIFFVTVFVHNHPQITEAVKSAAGPAGKIAGKIKDKV